MADERIGVPIEPQQISLPRPLGYDHPVKYGPLRWLQREQATPEAALVHDRFVHADQYQFYLHGALGDTILQMAYVRGMIAAIKRLRPDDPPITVMIPPALEPLAKHTIKADDPQITIAPLFQRHDQYREYLTTQHRETNQRIFAVNFPDIPNKVVGAGVREGAQLEQGLDKDITLISSVFTADALEEWTGAAGKERRIREHVRTLLSLSRKDIRKEDVEPVIKLPDNEREVYKTIAASHHINIDEDRIQVGFSLDSAQRRKVYDLEKWEEVMKGLAERLRMKYPGKKINFNVFIEPNPREPHFRKDDMEALLATQIPDVDINPIIEPSLGNVAILAKHQNLFVGTDSALGHIAAQVEGGPHSVGLFLNKLLTRDVWTSTKRHHGVTVHESDYDALIEEDIKRLITDDSTGARYIREVRTLQDVQNDGNEGAVLQARQALRERAMDEALAMGLTGIINLIRPEDVVDEAMLYV